MKAQELRIGNWVMGNDPYQITIQHLTIQCAHEFGDRDNYFEPIPLTEEWLVRFGFENINYGWEIELEIGKTLRLIVSDGWYYPQIEEAPEMSSGEIQIVSLNRIKYIHQLQNLYHALTGEELTIK